MRGDIALVRGGRLRPVPGEIEVGGPLETLGAGLGRHDAGHSVRADLTVHGRHDVPRAGLEDEANRFQHPACRAFASVVLDGDPRRVPDGIRQRGQVGDRLARPEPVAGIEMEALDEPRRPGAQFGGQGGEDLELRGGDHGPESELGGGARHPREEECLGFLAGHPGEPRAISVDQADAAVRAPFRVDRHA